MSHVVIRLVTIALIVAAFSLHAADLPTVIRIGYPGAALGSPKHPAIAGGALSVVLDQDLLDQEFAPDHIRIEWSFNKGAGPAVNELLAANQIDFAYLGDLPALLGRAAGIRTRLILAGGRGGNQYLAVPANSPIHSLAELKGHSVAVFKGTAGQLLANKVYALSGLSENDFKTINLDTGSGIAALVAGQVDAAWGIFTLLEQERRGEVRIIASARGARGPDGKSSPPGSQGVILVTESFADKYPQVVQRFVNVHLKAARFASEEANREALITTWAKTGIPADGFRREAQDVVLAFNHSPLIDPWFINRLNQDIHLSYEAKWLRKPFEVEDWVDTHFLQQGLVALGVEHYWQAYAVGDPVPVRKP